MLPLFVVGDVFVGAKVVIGYKRQACRKAIMVKQGVLRHRAF